MNNFSIRSVSLVTIFLFVIIFICRAWLMHDYLVLDGDRSLQVLAAEHLANGNGYVIPQVTAENLNLDHFEHLLEWPPLYSLMLLPFIWITSNDHLLSCFFLDTSLLFIYMLSLLWLLKLLKFDFTGKWLIVAISTLSFGGSIYYSFPTDLPAVTAILLAICCSLEFLATRRFKWVWMLSGFLLAAYFFRYMYLLAIPIIPLLFCWTGLKKKDNLLTRAGILILLITGFCIGIYFIYNYLQTGVLTYNYLNNKGFYPSNLLLLAPIFWQAFTDVNFWCVQLGIRSGMGYQFFMQVFKATSFVAIFIFFFNWIRHALKWKIQLTMEMYSNFRLIAGSVSLTIIITLAALSVLRSYYPLAGSTDGWTYFQEDRYFIFPVHFILISVVWFIYHGNLEPAIRGLAKLLLFTSSLFLFVHTAWMIYHHSNKSRTDFSLVARDNAARVRVLKQIFDSKKILPYDKVLITEEYGNMYFAAKNGIHLYRYPRTLANGNVLKVTKPTVVVLAIAAGDTAFYKPVVSNHGYRVAANSNDARFYFKFMQP